MYLAALDLLSGEAIVLPWINCAFYRSRCNGLISAGWGAWNKIQLSPTY
jgi:hypothetical protein